MASRAVSRRRLPRFLGFVSVARLATLVVGAALSAVPGTAAAQAAKPKPSAAPKKPASAPRAPAPAPEAPANAAAPAPPPKPTALLVRSRYTANAQVSENAVYFGNTRQRFEFPHLATLAQCDLGRTVQLSDVSKHYLVVSTDPAPAAAPVPVGTSGQADSATPAGKKGGVITVTVTTTDTGERKQVFGREARHVTIVTERQPDANACDKHAERVSVDGWYVDAPQMAAACSTAATGKPAATPASESSCTDRVETKTVGTAVMGLAVASTITTMRGPADTLTAADGGRKSEKDKEKDKGDATETSVTNVEVVALETKTVEASFFDIPADYTEVRTMAELLSTGSALPAAAVSDALSDALMGSVADGTRTVVPKTAGVTRVGLAPLANTSGREMPTSALNYNLMASLNKAPYDSVPLVGSTPADLERDARAKGCDYILTSTLTELRSSKPGKAGGLLKKVSGDFTPGSDNHDARVEYKLFAVDASDKPVATGTSKASSGGGFGVGSALKVAAFAGQLYLGAMTGMGGMGQFSALTGLGYGGGMGGLGLTNAMMGPGMSLAMASMSQVPGGMPEVDQNSAAAERTAGDAFRKAGGDVMEALRKKGSQGR